MDLNLFENNRKGNDLVNKFIEELKSALTNTISENQNKNKNEKRDEKNNELDEYKIYEKKKIFLDNRSRKGNELAWVMDHNSVCVSEDGDGGPISIKEINLPDDAKVGNVYEKIDGKYVYNSEITMELSEII